MREYLPDMVIAPRHITDDSTHCANSIVLATAEYHDGEYHDGAIESENARS